MKKQLYIKNKNIKTTILIKEAGNMKYSLCVADAHLCASVASQSAKSLKNETRVKRWLTEERLTRKNSEFCHTFKHIENFLELRTIFIHFRFWGHANGGWSVYCTPQRAL